MAHRHRKENQSGNKDNNAPQRLIFLTNSTLQASWRLSESQSPTSLPLKTLRGNAGGGHVRHVTLETRAVGGCYHFYMRVLCLVGRSSIFEDLAFYNMSLWMPRIWCLCFRHKENIEFIFNLCLCLYLQKNRGLTDTIGNLKMNTK